MDAIVGESYVSRNNTDRNNTASDEGGSSDKNTRKSSKSNSRRQPETTYGVSTFENDDNNQSKHNILL